MIAHVITNKDSLRLERFSQDPLIDVPTLFCDATMNTVSPQVGISASHRSIVQMAKEKNWEKVYILEDDIKPLAPLSLFLQIEKKIPQDADLFFGGVYDGEIGAQQTHYANLGGRISGLHCYIVYQKFYDKLLSVDPVLNLDYAISQLSPKMYVAYPFLAIQHDGYSYNAKTNTNYNYNLNKKYKLYGN